ncbi:MAG TPA: alpha/beta hydrolase-fold protein [Candidatus Limiplasma sp.]|nr:alpha/beta hydrolase-fold protein [Candidatus Limiplasma sp.]HRX08620.1 alpha/beta hydrolase-fold protein [Candidatus Limiplasma sp.]
MATITCNYFSKARIGQQTFTAILPVDPPPGPSGPAPYAQGPWPTIYLLHGYTGNHTDWLYHSGIQAWAGQRGYAVIMPAGGNTFFIDNEDTNERGGAFIGEELVTVTRNMFSLSHRREDTVIAGLSMGGYGAIRNGLHYPDVFGAVIALSSALITDEVAQMTPEGGGNGVATYGYYRNTFGDPKRLSGSDKDPKALAKARIADGNKPRMFLACGTEDFAFGMNDDYHKYLTEIGYPHEWWTRPGVHDFAFWNQSMPAGMDWLKQA